MDTTESLRYLRSCFLMQHHIFLQIGFDLESVKCDFEEILNQLLSDEFSIQSILLTDRTLQKEFCWSLMSASQKKSPGNNDQCVSFEASRSLIENIYSEQNELKTASKRVEIDLSNKKIDSDEHLPSDIPMKAFPYGRSERTNEAISKYHQHFSELPKVFLIYGLENAQVDIQSSLIDLIHRHKINTSFKMGDGSCYTASFPFSICCILQNTNTLTEYKSTMFTGYTAEKEILKYNFNLGKIPLSLRKSFFATLFFSKESIDDISKSNNFIKDFKDNYSKGHQKSEVSVSRVYVSTNIDRYVCKIISCIRMKAAPHGSPSPFFVSLCLAKSHSFDKSIPHYHTERFERSKSYMTEEQWIIHAAKIFATVRNRNYVTISDVQTMLVYCLVHKVSHIATMNKFLSSRSGMHEFDSIELPSDVTSPEYAFSHASFMLRPDIHLFDPSNLDALYCVQAAFAASQSNVSPFQLGRKIVPFAYSNLTIAMESQEKIVLGSLEKIKPPA